MMQIREMTLNDLEKIKDILQTDYDDFWNYNIFKEELNNEYSKYFCAVENEELLGFAGVWQSIDVMHINNIVVRKDVRGNHIGEKLLKKLLEYSKNKEEIIEITLEVNEDNKIARNLYEKYYFIPVRCKKKVL